MTKRTYTVGHSTAAIPVERTNCRTYIFTLDSLGSKHQQAWKLIGQYLKFEANDKKNIAEVSPSKGKLVDVSA